MFQEININIKCIIELPHTNFNNACLQSDVHSSINVNLIPWRYFVNGTCVSRYSPLDSLVQYRDGTSNDGVWKIKHDDNVKVGDVADFSNGQKQPSRTYGIQASLAPSITFLLT